MDRLKRWLLGWLRREATSWDSPSDHFAQYPGAKRVVAEVVAKMPVYGQENPAQGKQNCQ